MGALHTNTNTPAGVKKIIPELDFFSIITLVIHDFFRLNICLLWFLYFLSLYTLNKQYSENHTHITSFSSFTFSFFFKVPMFNMLTVHFITIYCTFKMDLPALNSPESESDERHFSSTASKKKVYSNTFSDNLVHTNAAIDYLIRSLKIEYIVLWLFHNTNNCYVN